MKKTNFLFVLFLFFMFSISAKNVSNGVVNFEIAAQKKNIIRLDGDWEFYKGQTFSTLTSSQLKIDFLEVPGSWSGRPVDAKVLPYGCHTYRAVIGGLRPNVEYGIFSRTSPALAARIFANGNFVTSYGNFSRNEANYTPSQQPMFCTFFSDKSGTVELVIQVTNFDQRRGGILFPIMFGLAHDINNLYAKTLLVISIIVGMLLFVFLANFLIWIFDKSHTQGLYFSIFLLAVLFRIAIGDFNIMAFFSKPIPYNIQIKLQNIIFLSFGFFSLIYRLDNFFILRFPKIDKVISSVALAFGILLLCLPIKLIPYIAAILILISILFYIYSIYRLTAALKAHNYDVAIYTGFYFVIFSGIILDTFFGKAHPEMLFNYTEIAALILTIITVFYLALYLEFLVQNYIQQKNKLSERYIAYRKFVPNELAHILNKESFGKIDLGDYARIKATIMVISEVVIPPDKTQISLRERFETSAFYSSKIVETIEHFNGTILSIAGNSIIALFTKKTGDAISAANKIKNLLQVMNTRRSQDYYPCVNFNISIHYGSMLLGIIGGKKRIDYTIISPNIEIANDICTLGYYKQIPIIISESAASNLEEDEITFLHPLGRIKFRQISYQITLYGLTSADDVQNDGKLEVPRAITQRDADKYIGI